MLRYPRERQAPPRCGPTSPRSSACTRGSSTSAPWSRYDPSTGTWYLTGGMLVPRMGHAMTLLPSGKVLVTGGATHVSAAYDSAELYLP